MYLHRTLCALGLAAALFSNPAHSQTPSAPKAPAVPEAPSQAPPPARTGWRVQGLPLLSFNSDEGLGYGARLMLVDSADGTWAPYRYALVGQFFQTTRGVAMHRLILDAPRLLSSGWRVGLELSVINDRFSPYYGQGGASAFVRAHAACKDRAALEADPNTCPGNPDFRGLRYYTFEQRTLPSMVFNLRRTLSGPWQLALGYNFRLTTVRARYEGEDLGQTRDSRLVEDAWAGRLDGLGPAHLEAPLALRTAEVTAGLLFDVRDNEPAPVRGMFHELTLRAASGLTGSGFDYWGGTANLRFYHPLGHERLVAALRLIVDVLGGQVPFFLLSSFGGVQWRDGLGGIGGVFTARGLLKNRLQGQVKALANGELRWTFASASPLKQRLDFTLVAFLDAGRAWADARLEDGGAGGFAGGGGVRVAWERNFILRLDYGVSPDHGTSGFYITFNHLF